MRLLGRYFVVILFLLSHLGFSQDQTVLTLEESVSIALDNNPELKMAQKELRKAKASIWEAYSTVLPKLDGSVSLEHAWEIQKTTIPNFLKPMLGGLGDMIPEIRNMPDFVQLSFGLENTFRYGLTLTQPLFLGGAGIAGIKMAYASSRAAENNVEAQKQNLIYNTSRAFYNCLVTQELINVQKQALTQAEANLDIVEKKYNVGMASGLDKMRAKVEVANIKPQYINARNNYQIALTQLRNILGLAKDTEIEIKGVLEFESDKYDQYSLKEMQNLAIENRPEIKALYEQKYITKKNMTIKKSSFMPKLFFQTDYSYLAMKNNLDFVQDDFSKGFTSALSLQIPIFHGFKNSKQYQKSKLDYKIMLDTEKQLKDGIFAQVEAAYNTYLESKEKYQAASESVELAEEALRLANLMYQEGASTQLEVLNSQLALTRARLNYVTSLFEYQTSRYELRKVTGTLATTLNS